MQMTKGKISNTAQVWPTNACAPLTRDQQIELMTTRHAARVERFDKMFKELDK